METAPEASPEDTHAPEAEEALVEEESVDGETAEDFHKQELKKVQERLGSKLDQERARRIEAEKRNPSQDEIDRKIKLGLEAMRKEMFSNRAEELAKSLATSDAERDLILHHYRNTIVGSGNIDQDIESAYLLANKNKMKATINELRKANASKISRGGTSDAGQPPKRPEAKVQLSADEQSLLQRINQATGKNFTPEEFIKQSQQ